MLYPDELRARILLRDFTSRECIRRYTPITMEVYKAETREILRRYRAGKITRSTCITALDAAIAGLEPFLATDQLKTLHASMKSTHEALPKEAKRGKPHRKSN
jgi:hypothetical protein